MSKELVEALEELADLMDDVRNGSYKPDSYTTQPARAALAAHRERECKWTPDDDGTWNTECGRAWVFDNDGPVENKAGFCMGCGGKLIALPPAPAAEGRS